MALITNILVRTMLLQGIDPDLSRLSSQPALNKSIDLLVGNSSKIFREHTFHTY